MTEPQVITIANGKRFTIDKNSHIKLMAFSLRGVSSDISDDEIYRDEIQSPDGLISITFAEAKEVLSLLWDTVKEELEEPKIDEGLEQVVDEALEEFLEFEKLEQQEKQVKFIDQFSIIQAIHEVNKNIHQVDKNVLSHKKEDHTANIHFGKELTAIHKFQGKWILIVLFLNAIVFTAFGAILHNTKTDWMPYIGLTLEGAKTFTNLIR